MAGASGPSHRSRSEARETEILHGGGRAFSDADETQVLRGGPGTPATDADQTAVLPSVGAAGTHRPGGDGADVRRPGAADSGGRSAAPAADPGRANGWSAFDRPSARRADAFPAAGETRPAPTARDPWAEAPEETERSERPERSERSERSVGAARSDGPGATHDPHEVTVQLDGVGLHLDNMLRAAKDAPRGGESSDGPVFVDESGRRSRRFRRIGMAVGLACAVYAVVIVATLLSGNSDAPWLPVENPKENPAGKVDTPPLPAESAPQPSATGSVSPGTSPTAGTDATASPGADASAPGASATAENPAASADPKPSATKSTRNPGTNTTPDPDPTTEPTSDPDPDPSPTDGGGPTEEPTDPATTDEPATGTVANGPSDPSPVAQEPGTNASAPADPSPEYTF
ncbi:hypothetical protein [Streptomyces coerulescens]|uniref:Translation initiation factor IF-2 n=1 Tax=Streptomyces coerulescens TaxID=29304 RepID=A0ABW0CNT0_STRCD